MKSFAKLILVSALAAFSFSAAADEIAAYGVHIGSHHFPSYEYNNVNPGVYVRMTSGMTYGTYYNSERRVSVYAGYTKEWGRWAVTVGAVSGYSMGKDKTRIYPMIVPSVKLGKVGDTTFRIAVLPQISKNKGATAVHLMAEW